MVASCPIDRYAAAGVWWSQGPPGCLRVEGLEGRPKAAEALRTLLAAQGRGGRVAVFLRNPAPSGRGYGTSSADILAVLAAVTRAQGARSDPACLTRLARRIEPTDGVAFPGVAVLDAGSGETVMSLPPPPPLPLLVLDPGGAVETVAFHRRRGAREGTGAAGAAVDEALAALVEGLRAGDPRLLGEAATASARAHQLVLEQPLLPVAWDIGRSLDAYGVVRAHTGTILGLLFPPDADRRKVTARVRSRLPAGVATFWTVVRGGGMEPAPAERGRHRWGAPVR